MVATADSGVASVSLAEAHRRLLADRSLQFDFVQTPPPKPPPHWLEELLRLLGPVMKYAFWGLVILFGLLIAAFLLRELMGARFGSWRRKPKSATADETWRPTEASARLLLAQADALAAEGRFADAAHHLLLHSIQNVEDHRPRTIRPALTSRDIADLHAIPARARAAFARMAAVVERSLFGGQAVDAAQFADCRAAYEDFVFAETPV